MALPSLYSISTGKSIQTAFGGLNETYGCAEAEFTEMKNFSSRGYPALQTRTPRRTMRAMGRCNGMYHLNGLLLCEGTTVIRNAQRLRLKESDRIAAMEAELRACGGVLGVAGMFLMADFPAGDVLTAAAVGIVSGLAATGVNQAGKQLFCK